MEARTRDAMRKKPKRETLMVERQPEGNVYLPTGGQQQNTFESGFTVRTIRIGVSLSALIAFSRSKQSPQQARHSNSRQPDYQRTSSGTCCSNASKVTLFGPPRRSSKSSISQRAICDRCSIKLPTSSNPVDSPTTGNSTQNFRSRTTTLT